MSENVECVVIGAGVVGLAVARALALRGLGPIVVEAERAIGTGTSSRNSEVIHAGIYYPRGSLKAVLCVEGRRRLYAYCADRGVEHRRCGKLIVATSEEQLPALRSIAEAARANGVDDLRWLEADAARSLEPELCCVAALESPSTGIVDSHGLMLALRGDLEVAGGMVALGAPVLHGRVSPGTIVLEIGGDAPMELHARRVVNCAGLNAQAVARTIDGVPPQSVPPIYYAKGNYFSLSGRAPFSRLVYPIPERAGLGVHLTLDLAGRARFGPDVEWIDSIDYTVDPRRADRFYAEIRRYWPRLPDGALQPAYAGIRPKLHAPNEPSRDFSIQGPKEHGIPGLVNLYGIESPGLTASLAIAERVADALGD